MNNKAQIPEAVLILVAIALCATALYYVYAFAATQAKAVDITGAVNMRYAEKSMAIYLEDYSKMMLQQAYADAIKSQKSCQSKLGTADIWDDCMPNDQEIKNHIKDNFNERVLGSGKQATSMISDKLYVAYSAPFNASENTSVMEYRLNNIAQFSFSLEYPKIEMKEIYDSVMAKRTECNSDSKEVDEIVKCLYGLKFDNWSIKITPLEVNYLFEMESKDSYFYDNSYKPVIVQFAIRK